MNKNIIIYIVTDTTRAVPKREGTALYILLITLIRIYTLSF